MKNSQLKQLIKKFVIGTGIIAVVYGLFWFFSFRTVGEKRLVGNFRPINFAGGSLRLHLDREGKIELSNLQGRAEYGKWYVPKTGPWSHWLITVWLSNNVTNKIVIWKINPDGFTVYYSVASDGAMTMVYNGVQFVKTDD